MLLEPAPPTLESELRAALKRVESAVGIEFKRITILPEDAYPSYKKAASPNAYLREHDGGLSHLTYEPFMLRVHLGAVRALGGVDTFVQKLMLGIAWQQHEKRFERDPEFQKEFARLKRRDNLMLFVDQMIPLLFQFLAIPVTVAIFGLIRYRETMADSLVTTLVGSLITAAVIVGGLLLYRLVGKHPVHPFTWRIRWEAALNLAYDFETRVRTPDRAVSLLDFLNRIDDPEDLFHQGDRWFRKALKGMIQEQEEKVPDTPPPATVRTTP